MKNPIEYLRHIVKDPITTIAEADARKKKIMPLLYGSAGVLAVGLILQVVAKLDFMAAFSFIGLVGTAFCAFLFSVIKSAKRKFEALTCNKCNTLAEIKTSEDFAKYVSYIVERDEAVYKGTGAKVSPTNGVHSLVKITASSSAVVSVYLTCPHCGEVKHLKYYATPFKCHAEQKNVRVIDYQEVYSRLDTAVRTAINDYNTPEKRDKIPYTFQSSKNPNFENRYSFKGANGSVAHPDYMGAGIDYHKDVEEMLEHYVVLNELNGTLSDPDKSSKKKSSLPKSRKKNTADAQIVAQERKENLKDQKSAQKSSAKPVAVILVICAALVVGGIIYGLVSAGREQGTKDDATNATTESTLDHSETETTTDPVEKINVNDYVGYWHIKANQEKELTIHNGNSDSVIFSLWYHNENELNNVVAQLQDNVASFSMAAEGAVIKGTLTFHKAAITVRITQSTLATMPVEEIEFTEQDMTSWAHGEETTESTENGEANEDASTVPSDEPSEETNPTVNEVPYLFQAKNDSYSIYSGPSYDSDFVDSLPVGTYTIVEEEYDENNNLWGKLKSGLGWICIEGGTDAT